MGRRGRFSDQNSIGDRHLYFSTAFPRIHQSRTILALFPRSPLFSLCHAVLVPQACTSQMETGVHIEVRWSAVVPQRRNERGEREFNPT